ncbi:hypothetical protein Ahy_B06g081002 [Arachis hypogaea]|uniref:soluble epoxide hydrolase n=2 Tax=Arachis TaxID=3817 RepID=A0A444YJP7_ARAHY|nr:hypothetical protein Ahy_B06g081002 [Arachis hypogaea]
METIQHRTVPVNGINMHVAEKGEGPVLLFLHGFPELWYTWRHQILALSSKGYRCVAPDLRGYGDTDVPESVSSYTCFHIVGDIVALIDSLGVDQVFLVAHDWGAMIGWFLCMFRPERIKAYVCLSVPLLRRHPTIKTVDGMRFLYGDDYYICRFQEPGEIEGQIAQVGTLNAMKNILTTRKTGPPILPKGQFGNGVNESTPETLPSWLTQDDLDYFVSKFEKTGFTGGLNYYRNLNLNWELTAPWSGAKIKVPVKFITGDMDMVYTSLGMKDYIESGLFKEEVPNLEEVIIQEGVAHFNNQEAAEDVTNHIYTFITKRSGNVCETGVCLSYFSISIPTSNSFHSFIHTAPNPSSHITNMETIEHKTVEVNGIKMHVAEKGEGPVVLFLHGFPELWYTWRHQILSLSSKGYRCVAPDLRGYGDTDAPSSVSSYTCFHIVGDIVALMDSLGVDQVFLVAHDWGAIIGWYLSMFRPDRVKAYVCLSVPFLPRNPNVKPVDAMRALYGDDYYICRFQEPGKAEAEFGKAKPEHVIKKMFCNRATGPPILPKQGMPSNPPSTTEIPLPNWLTQEDLAYFASKFEKTGFTGPLNYYRNMNLNWELTAAWTGVQIKVPVKFITGELDMVYTSPSIKQYIESGAFKRDVPDLQDVVVQQGVAHFNNQEAAVDVTNHIYDFINKF